MATVTTDECKTSDIREGDVIRHFGMRLRVDREMREYYWPDVDFLTGPVWSTSALIENWDEVASYVGNLARIDESGQRRWTIQGNNLAKWMREREQPVSSPAAPLDTYSRGAASPVRTRQTSGLTAR
ncbi:hypothetical protein [Mycobacteroides abscessus]|uniref:hypothetical protein n=1 Tax=Mycobacteroides abscessus TaxID=36809 RepID=UPI00104201F2|nr:hypothetical protein [Mycobacteroides abscessus]